MEHSIPRRDFLRQSLAVASTGLVGNVAGRAGSPGSTPVPANPEGEWRNRQSGMRYRRLGRTGYMVSEILCGGNAISPTTYNIAEIAIEMGLNYLDTAPAYGDGQSERGYSAVIKGSKRDRVFLNTKVSPLMPRRNEVFAKIFASLSKSEQAAILREATEDIEQRRIFTPAYFGNYYNGQFRQAEASALSNVMEKRYGSKIDRRKGFVATILRSVDDSLQRLGTDHVDLMMCPHGATSAAEASIPEVFEAFELLKKQGKVRFLGVSSHTDPARVLKAAIESGVYSVAMIAYSFLNREYVEPLIEEAHQRDLGVIAMKAARALMSPDPDEDKSYLIAERVNLLNQIVPGDMSPHLKGYRYALNNPHISAVISGMDTEQMVRENLPLARG